MEVVAGALKRTLRLAFGRKNSSSLFHDVKIWQIKYAEEESYKPNRCANDGWQRTNRWLPIVPKVAHKLKNHGSPDNKLR